MLICLLLEKQSPRIEDGKIKDGFHLRFPHFIISQEIGDIYFRDQLISKLENANTFKNFHTINDLKSIVDPVMKKNWLLYGSAKSEEKRILEINQNF